MGVINPFPLSPYTLLVSDWSNAVLKSVIAATFIGVLGGFWVALLNDSIEVFQNYVDGVWRYQVAFRSVAPILVGAVIGALSGSNIRYALAHERTDGFIRGALVGAAVGVLLILAQIAFVAIAAKFGDYRLSYQPLLTRLSGMLFVAAVLGAAVGAVIRNRPPVGVLPGALVGALIGVAFVLPAIVTTTLFIISLTDAGYPDADFVLTYLLPDLVSPIAGAATGALVGAARRTTPAALILAATAAVTASSVPFLYIIGLAFLHISSAPVVYAIRILVGVLVGVAVGIMVIAAARGDRASQS